MDRFLIVGATLLLIFEVTFLVSGLGEPVDRSRVNARGAAIGSLISKTNSVHRRNSNSLVWDETEVADPLYAYDSVLTLSDSTAHLKLNGETKLDLDRDTLVVLEPSGESTDGRLKIRFSRGSMRAKNASAPVVISDASVRIEAEAGADVQLVGLEDGRLHVDVTSGTASIETPNGTSQVHAGDSVVLKEGTIESHATEDHSLSFESDLRTRFYSDSFPIEAPLRWRGKATALETLDARRKLEVHHVEGEESTLSLGPGESRVWLVDGDRKSTELVFDVRARPTLRPLSPTASARTDHDVEFVWESSDVVAKYRLELSRSEKFETIEAEFDSSAPRFRTKLTQSGTYFWRVRATDDVGLDLPAGPASSFTVGPAPIFEAPKLNAPQIREPADDESLPSKGAGLLFDLFFPRAEAFERQVEAVLTWQPLDGADSYLIEISATADFEHPLVSRKVTEPKFVYRGARGSQVHWRVAAAAGDVRGPFSEAAVVKLEGVKSFDKPKTAVVREPTPTPAPTPQPEPVAVAASVPTPAATPEPSPAPSFADTTHRKRGRVVFSPAFRQSMGSNDQNVHASFSGAVPISLTGESYFADSDRGRAELALSFESTKWKPLSASRQDDVQETRWSFAAGYRRRSSPWSYSVAAESVPLVARIASEQIEIQPQTLFGANARYTETWLAGLADLEIDLRYGAIWGGRLKAALDYPIGSSKVAIGPQVAIELFKGDGEKRSAATTAGLHLGIDW